MNDVVEIVGYEHVISESGAEGTRVYCTRPLGAAGEGVEAIRHYINPKYCQYVPVIGAHVVVITSRYGNVSNVYTIA